jgi:threonylcarbamoyladenosine tRNA methylthiotransferase MtaB
MQSGSDLVLRRMRRRYRPWHYCDKIQKIRAAMPAAAIGADVMVGFPGETEDDFEDTRRMIGDLPFTYLHVFTYSPRPGTPAAAMGNQVPVHVARKRNGILRELASQKKLAFMRSFVGKTIEAITLNGSSDSGHSGPMSATSSGGESKQQVSGATYTETLTDNYLKLRLEGQHEANRWINARVETVEGGVLVGIAS